MKQVWVICEDGQRCGKLPCMALLDSSINIKKFKECFWSHESCNWRLAEGAETMFPKCATCAAYKAESAPKAPNTQRDEKITLRLCNHCDLLCDKRNEGYCRRGFTE